MSHCSVDGQVSWPFPCRIIRGRDVFAAATACIDSITAKMRRKTAIIVEVTVTTRTSCVQIAANSVTWIQARQIIAFIGKAPEQT